MLNVVNFGAGTYVLYAEIHADGTIEVDPEPYGDSFARPARLLPVEAKALVAAIDLIGEHIPEGSLASVREQGRRGARRGPGPRGTADRHRGRRRRRDRRGRLARDRQPAAAVVRVLQGERGRVHDRLVEPYALINGREGWYVASFDPARESVRHFRLDRIKSATVTDEHFEPRPDVDPAADVDGWPRTGEVPASRRARVWISPERARWAREERDRRRRAVDDGSVIVELGFAGVDWLVREVLKEAGDAVVLEPADAREAVRGAAEAIAAADAVKR